MPPVAACVIGSVSSLGYLDAPAILPTPPHPRSLPVSLTEKNILLVSTFQLLTVHKIELGSTGGVPKTTYSNSFDKEALGS